LVGCGKGLDWVEEGLGKRVRLVSRDVEGFEVVAGNVGEESRLLAGSVPPPLSGDYTPKPQEEIDDSLYVYGKLLPWVDLALILEIIIISLSLILDNFVIYSR
ncbi:hypothetical protein Tco_0428882, partial [Tanacetum coccineum]